MEVLHLVGHLGWNAGTLPAVDLCLLDPVMQRLQGAADLGCNRHARSTTFNVQFLRDNRLCFGQLLDHPSFGLIEYRNERLYFSS